MDADRLRAFLLQLPHVTETMQWGANLVFWAGDKAIGGKMFALVDLDEDGPHPHRKAVLSYAAGPERYPDLLELEGILPAPYLARAFWVAAERWDVFPNPEWETQLRTAYQLTFARLPPRTRAVLALPPAQQKRLIAERKKLLAARAATKAQ